MKHKNMDVIPPGQRRLAWLNIGIQAVFPLAVAFAPAMAGATSVPRFLNTPEEQTLLRTRVYSLSSGETVTSVAQKFNMSVDSLRKLNQLRSFARGFENLRPGDELDVPLSPLPKIMWDESTAAGNIRSDQQAQNVAAITSQAGSFVAGGASKDAAASMARGMAAGEASGQLQQWLSQFGTARVQLDADENFSLKNSQFDLLAPLYDRGSNLVFSQGSLHRTDGRTQANLGFGLRHFTADYMVGGNAFGDYDLSRDHARMGMGVEYWRDFLKLGVNGYMRLTGWQDSPDVVDYEERPANGWDVRAQAWLPQLPQLGGKLTYEQYYGDEVALFGKENRQSNPYAVTAGLNYTPVPLVTFSAEQRQGQSGKNDTRLGLEMTWQLGVPWRQQVNPAAVAAMRSLAGSRYDLVERNNNIVLEYRKKEVIRLQAAAQVSGYAGEQKPLNVSVSSKYGLERIDWSASSLVAAGGKIVQNGADYAVILPVYQPSAQGINSYTLSGVAVDKKGNRSNRSETQITVQAAVINAENSTVMPASSTLVSDGKSTQVLVLALKDERGGAVDVAASDISPGVGSLKSASVSSIVRKGAGVYEVTVTAGTDEERVTIAPQVSGIKLAQAEVLITAPVAVQVNSAINTDRASYIAGSDMALTVTLKDTAGKALTGATSSLTTDSVKVPNGELKAGSSWQDNGDGTYTATYIAKTAGAGLKATVTLNGWSTGAESAAYAITQPEAVEVNSAIGIDKSSYVSGDDIVVTVTLKDTAGKVVTGAASSLTTDSVKVPNGELKAGSRWQDNGDGTYTATYIAKTAGTGLKATVTLSNWSTGAESAVYEITPAAVITLKEIAVNGYNFAPDAGFPTMGFIGAKFSLVPGSGRATDYTWSADAPWVTVNDGVVSFTGVGSRDKVTITGTPTGDGDEITWSFSLTSWFAFGAGDVTRDEANNYCNNMTGYGLATKAQLTAGNGALRGLLGSFWSEWGNAWLADDYVWSSSYDSSNGSNPVLIAMKNGATFQWTGGGWGEIGEGDIIAGCRKDL
ncbi:inverse autotransporter beta domain-containing protein [Cedecea davisae]|uniref:inverse autotransporter beta domain-containing protein n=1 Tax=Cedecea davisae TaxID=158484 RepID=UPI001D0BBDED|nr:inverse autotransporter beta domain-containing protein [Cedecea davisae]